MAILIVAPFYLIANYWLYTRIIKIVTSINHDFAKKSYRITILCLILFFCITPLVGVLLPTGGVKAFFTNFGNTWLALDVYTILFTFIVVLFRFVYRKVKKEPKKEFSPAHNTIVMTCILMALVLIVGLGVVNAQNIETTNYEVNINKKCSNMKSLNAVLVADLHLGFNIGAEHMKQMVDKINKCNPDVVFIAGDVFDNNYEAIANPDDISKILRGIKSKYGIYACYGNHDVAEKILAGFTFSLLGKKVDSEPRMDKFLENSNIKLLRDESQLVANSFYVFGRKDYMQVKKAEETRKTPSEIISKMDKTKPIIVVDHEPRDLDELSQVGVDVDLCGHTHDGQIFPINILTNLIWKNSYGKIKIDNMTNIVTSGVGLYGPDMRIGTIAEICNIKMNFK